MAEVEQAEQGTLFDLTSTDVQFKIPGENMILFVPMKPIYHKALKLQNLLSRLEIQLERMPGQFSSKNYMDALNAFEIAATTIREEMENERLSDAGKVGDVGDGATTPPVGNGDASSVGLRISADNPAAG